MSQLPMSPGSYDPNAELAAKRKRKMAEMLIEQGNKPLVNEQAGGMTVARSPFEFINQAAQKYVGGRDLESADNEQAALDKRRQDMIAQALGTGDMQATAQILAQDPNTSQQAMGMYQNALERDRMEAMQREGWARQEAMQRAGWDHQARMMQNRTQGAPLPVGALKMQGETIDALDAANKISELSSKLTNQVKNGQLNLGPMANFLNSARNWAGASNPESVAFSEMNTDLEKLRNDTLRLNKGVQTEGDAQRAMNEVIASKNDPKVFAAAMGRLNEVNTRAAQLQQIKVNDIRGNYGREPYDFSAVNQLTPRQPAPMIAENPQTGERLINRGNGWEPYNGQ